MGIGDDTAIWDIDGTKILTVDSLVSGVHFKEEWGSWDTWGDKLLRVNLSDIAAMGGIPEIALLSLVIPKNLSNKRLKEFIAGLIKSCREYEVELSGGNLSSGKEFSAHLTLIGRITNSSFLTRDSAEVGELIIVSGTLGDSNAGLRLLNSENNQYKISKKDKEYLINRFLKPVPRLELGRILNQKKITKTCIDISDGLLRDLYNIIEPSNKGAEIYFQNIPISDELRNFATLNNIDPLNIALSGGEDYELIFTVTPELWNVYKEELKRKTNINLTPIGRIIEMGFKALTLDKKTINLSPEGWEHFKSGKK